jgi:hypothetical protein
LVVEIIFVKSLAMVDFSTEPLNGGFARMRVNDFRGRQAPPKPEVKRVLPSKPPRQIPSLLTMTWMGVVRKDEGVSNVW